MFFYYFSIKTRINNVNNHEIFYSKIKLKHIKKNNNLLNNIAKSRLVTLK